MIVRLRERLEWFALRLVRSLGWLRLEIRFLLKVFVGWLSGFRGFAGVKIVKSLISFRFVKIKIVSSGLSE